MRRRRVWLGRRRIRLRRLRVSLRREGQAYKARHQHSGKHGSRAHLQPSSAIISTEYRETAENVSSILAPLVRSTATCNVAYAIVGREIRYFMERIDFALLQAEAYVKAWDVEAVVGEQVSKDTILF